VTDDLEAVAEIARMGKNVATVDVELSTGSDGTVAVGRGVYKVGGREESAWSGE
jgi:acyl-coenzyme A thioesterase PaaI-like protein